MEQLTPKKAVKYMENEGITTLTDADCDLPLALGGLQKGSTPLAMAAAYACIANNGKYIEPVFYTKIENSNGKVILKNKQKSKKVYSEDTAYILKNLSTGNFYDKTQNKNSECRVTPSSELYFKIHTMCRLPHV